MLEAHGDIWEHAHEYDAIVITTNGFVKNNGEAVIGSGIALEAKKRFPNFAKHLGKALQTYGNVVWAISGDEYPCWIITMPTKPAFGPNGEPGWKAKSDINLIEDSAWALQGGTVKYIGLLANINLNPDKSKHIGRVLMPRPGCGSGGLKWEDVKKVIAPILDDRFTVMERNGS